MKTLIVVVLLSVVSLSADASASVEAACQTVWSDFFSAPELERQYGPGASAEVKVEVCDFPTVATAKLIRVSRRLYREFADGQRIREESISGWAELGTKRVDTPGPVGCDKGSGSDRSDETP